MNKFLKGLACVAGGAAIAIGSVVLVDRYLGKNYLGTPTGRVVGRCYKDGKYFLYVRRFNNIDEVEVDRDTCLAVQNGDYFNMASDGSKPETRRRAQPEDVLDFMPDEDEMAALFEEPECTCTGTCNGECMCDADDCVCEDTCECGEECECDPECQCNEE